MKICDALKTNKILFSDGAWGTSLYKKGFKFGDCPETWCLDHEDDLIEIAKSYVDAGCDMISTNSFGGSSINLEKYGLKDRASEINQIAVKLSKSVTNNQWVIASMGPCGKMFIMEEVTESELYESFKEQAIAFEKGGADAVCIETMTDINEARIAISAVKENTNLEVICTYTFDKTANGDYMTFMGFALNQAVETAIKAGADIIGTNCGNGIVGMIDIVKTMRQLAPDKYIMVQSNAGLPTNINGETVYKESPLVMVNNVNKLIEAGANIIGGCCGTTPEHIKAMKAAVK